jgi:cytochrome c oxidase assembly protein subunit 11
VNEQNQTIVAQAIPSYAPKIATQHFTKLECFCFQQQSLAPKESREMPVMFVIDPNLPKDVKTITLSYTFFEIQSAQPVVRGEVKPSKI